MVGLFGCWLFGDVSYDEVGCFCLVLVFCGICFGGCIGVYGGVVFAVGFVWDVCYA